MDPLEITNDQLTLGRTLLRDKHGERCVLAAQDVARSLKLTDPLLLADLKEGSALHDVGKAWVPQWVVDKAGPFELDEHKVMQTHPIRGAEFLSKLGVNGGIAQIVRHHHERWNGQGYPDGLSGEQIPMLARIVAVIDTYDALREHRNYPRYTAKGERLKGSGEFSHEDALRIIEGGAYTYFDPRVVRAFCRLKAREFR